MRINQGGKLEVCLAFHSEMRFYFVPLPASQFFLPSLQTPSALLLQQDNRACCLPTNLKPTLGGALSVTLGLLFLCECPVKYVERAPQKAVCLDVYNPTGLYSQTYSYSWKIFKNLSNSLVLNFLLPTLFRISWW